MVFHLASADDVLVSAQCDSCHALTPPVSNELSAMDWQSKKGPDLFYAGNKYRPEWLRAWLLEPKRIRPAGLHPYLHVMAVDGVDQIDESTLAAHPVVEPAQVDELVDVLMTYAWGQKLLISDMKPAAIPRPLAELNFIKFKGCASCHRISETFGGVSGPELYTAWQRLQPAFLWSYIANPQAWDPVAPMPGYDLPPVEVGKLTAYLRLLAEE
jgi:hypothetical protein